jgi:hypothetical protein
MRWIKEYVFFTGKYQKEILDNSGNASNFLNELLSGIISKSGLYYCNNESSSLFLFKDSYSLFYEYKHH